MSQVAAEKAIPAGETECCGRRVFQGIFDAHLQFRCHTLVGVEAKDPIVTCMLYRELLLRSEAQPVLMNDTGAMAYGQIWRAIAAARIDDEDLVGEAHALQAGFQLRGRVERDDGDGERLARGGHL